MFTPEFYTFQDIVVRVFQNCQINTCEQDTYEKLVDIK